MAAQTVYKSVVQILADTSKAESQLRELEKLFNKIKSDQTYFKIGSDANDLIKVKNVIDQIISETKGKDVLFHFDESVVKKYEQSFENLGTTVQEVLNLMSKGNFKADAFSSISASSSELNTQLKEQQSVLKENKAKQQEYIDLAKKRAEVEEECAKRVNDARKKYRYDQSNRSSFYSRIQ